MAATESVTAINEMSRHGGFSPVQRLLARFPRKPATLGDEAERFGIGALQGFRDGPTAFAIQAKYRQQAKQAFVKWDCGSRVQRGILKNAVPVPGPYKVGDIISYCRRARQGESGIQWSVGSRIVGFESDANYPGRAPAYCWLSAMDFQSSLPWIRSDRAQQRNYLPISSCTTKTFRKTQSRRRKSSRRTPTSATSPRRSKEEVRLSHRHQQTQNCQILLKNT